MTRSHKNLTHLHSLTYDEAAGCSAGAARLVWDQEVGGSNPPTPTMTLTTNIEYQCRAGLIASFRYAKGGELCRRYDYGKYPPTKSLPS